MGYNSGRYDLCLLARPLFKLLEQQLPVKSSENLLNPPPPAARGAVGARAEHATDALRAARVAPAGGEVDLGLGNSTDDIFTTVEWPAKIPVIISSGLSRKVILLWGL